MKKIFIALIILFTASITLATYPTQKIITENYVGTVFIQDDFLTGGLTTGIVGDIGWDFDGSPTVVTSPLTTANHPGILRISTPASSSTVNLCLKLCSATTGKFDLSNNFDVTVILTTVNWATTNTYMGIFVGDIGPTTNYIGFQGRPGLANWRLMATGASITDSGVAIVDGTWAKLRFIKIGNTVEYYINNTYVGALTTTATGQAQPFFQVNTGNTTVRSFDIDYFSLTIPSIVR